ncbi:MAG: ERF family protein [Eubacteriales bacterium]|nr:ERF family protein [Eubacteriales bacterium]
MNIYEKINAIMEAVGSLQKDGKVAFGSTKYNYLSEAKTTAEIRKRLIKHKLVILPIEVDEKKEGQITQGKYRYKMVNVENPEEFIILESGGQGHDSADKGSGKASTYAYKYLMWRTFAIPSSDDPDQISSEEIKAKEADEATNKATTEEIKNKATMEEVKDKMIDDAKVEAISIKLKTKGVSEEQICNNYGVAFIEALTVEQWANAMRRLDHTPDRKIENLGL